MASEKFMCCMTLATLKIYCQVYGILGVMSYVLVIVAVFVKSYSELVDFTKLNSEERGQHHTLVGNYT